MLNHNSARPLALDLNSDGRTDYLMGTLDRVDAFLQSASGGFTSRSLSTPTPDAGWAIAGTGNFDQDQFKDDILWRNNVTDMTVVAIGQGDQPAQLAYSAQQRRNYSPDLADFNGDGITDILWHDSQSGQLEMWFMAGDLVVKSLPDVASSWVPTLADFNQDGKADLFWQDSATGEITVWLLDGDRLINSTKVELPGNAGNLELYDFTGDGRTDIFDRNRLTGANRLWVWGEDGLAPNPAPVLLPSSRPDGSFIFADFNGDGRTDSLFRAPGQSAATWLFQANGTVVTADLPGLNDLIVNQVNDFDGDGKVDLLLTNDRADKAQLWLLDGAIVRQVRDFNAPIGVPATPPLISAPAFECAVDW
jgi:FG-GAP-like repeat